MNKNPREHQYILGISLQQEATKTYGKALLFAAALVMSHLLGIEPSEAETLGLKFTTPDPVILHGSLALIFLHYLFRLISFSERGASMFHMRSEAAQMRYYIRTVRHQYRKKTPVQVKKAAKGNLIFYQVEMSPYWIVAWSLIILSFLVAVVDVIGLIDYVISHSESLADIFGYEIANGVTNASTVTDPTS